MPRQTVNTQENITLRDIYDIQARLENKLDERLSKLEGRTDNLETYRDRAMGVLGAFSLFSGLISNWIWERISK